jgi:predicted kinase
MNRPTVTMTRGLPGSGKTTWARGQQAADPAVVLVSKDELRAMLHDGRFSAGNEGQVVAVRDAIVVDTLMRGRDVIVHDTNLHPDHAAALKEIARLHDATFVVKDFTEVPLDTCIARDAARAHPVGATVIRAMWRDFLSSSVSPPAASPSVPASP